MSKWAIKTIELTLDVNSQNEDGQTSTYDDGSDYRSETSDNTSQPRGREIVTENGTVVYKRQKSNRRFPLKKKKKITQRQTSSLV